MSQVENITKFLRENVWARPNKIKTYVNPLTVSCPKCKAAISARCTESVRDGNKFVSFFHEERIQKATI